MMWWMAAAMAGDPGALLGTWTWAGSTAENDTRVASVEDVAQRFNFAIRPIARSKLLKVAALDTSVAITGDAKAVKIVFTGDNARTSGGPTDGTAVVLEGNNVTYTVSDGKMVVRGTSGEGGKESVYTVAGDAMTVKHTVWSPQMGDPPLTWSLTYTREK